MLQVLLIIGIAVLIFGIIATLHEFGHYLAATLQGIKVETFNVFIGPKLYSFKYRGTEFSLRLIPFYGYVTIPLRKNHENEKGAEEPPGKYLDDATFFQQTVVFLAGCTANFILAFVAWFALLVCYGQPVVKDRLSVAAISAESVGAKAGIQVGDRITGIWNQAVHDWSDIEEALQSHKEREIVLHIQRNEKSLDVTLDRSSGASYQEEVTLSTVNSTCLMSYGVRGESSLITFEKKNFFEAFKATAIKSKLPFVIIVDLPYALLPHKLRSTISEEVPEEKTKTEVAGVLLLGGILKDALANGVPIMLSIFALINWSLISLNLFPIPPFDGGRILLSGFVAALRRIFSQQTAKRFEGYAEHTYALIGIVVALYVMSTWVIRF